MMRVTVQGQVAAPLAQAWDRFVPIDLTAIFRGLGPLPAVVAVTDQSGIWDRLGETRHVHLADGSVLTEQITDVAVPQDGAARFGYVVRGFSGVIGRLTDEARGNWQFQQQGRQTAIVWDYAFRPKGRAAGVLLGGIVSPLWRRYMTAALARTGVILSQGVSS